jgi:GSH-dependent disulfide-bond oxidoreductase
VKSNPGKSTYAEERYAKEAKRRRLLHRRYRDLAVDLTLRLADSGVHDYPNVKRWYLVIAARPAVRRGYDVFQEGRPIPMP